MIANKNPLVTADEEQILGANGLSVLNKKYVETNLISMFEEAHTRLNDLTHIMEIIQNPDMFISNSLKEILTNVINLKKFLSDGVSRQYFYENIELISTLFAFGAIVYTINLERSYLTSVCFNLNKRTIVKFFLSREGNVVEVINTPLYNSFSIANYVLEAIFQSVEEIIDEEEEKEQFDNRSLPKSRKGADSHSSNSTKHMSTIPFPGNSPERRLYQNRNEHKHTTEVNLTKPFSRLVEQVNYQRAGDQSAKARYMTSVPNDSPFEDPNRKYHGPYTYIPGNDERKETKAIILGETRTFNRGVIKYFDSVKEFGFITPDIQDEFTELFFHFHDVFEEKLTKEVLSLSKMGIVIKVQFKIMDYVGKYERSKKAVQISLSEEAKKSGKFN